ncbi:alpha/beta fold hydrolase [Streptomyces sp. Ac-502]|uniref:alpha/beta fold hydrolase n=1 Tax=Streptomyces sp. Ac-502 TaxID=3342801 RepID=UPI0038622062
MGEQLALNVGPARMRMAYECFGDVHAPPVLLVMGCGAQMIAWPEEFCAELAHCGLRVIRFDNRDVGRSSRFPDLPGPDLPGPDLSGSDLPAPGLPNLALPGSALPGPRLSGPGLAGPVPQKVLTGDFSLPPYTLSDMANDIVGLLDVLHVRSAHLVGASLGGMIAQTMAVEHPGRTRSLTSMMSSTGDRAVGRPDTTALAGLGAPPQDRRGFIAWQIRALRAVASPGFAFDEAAATERAERAYDRGHDPAGMVRQFAAALASGDRTARLRSVRVPVLVIHGTDDVLIDMNGGRATAAAIPGAELAIIDGMGHSLPRELWPQLVLLIAHLIHRVETASRTGAGETLRAG